MPVTHLHAARLDPDEVVVVAGLRVTSVARTVLDVARSLPFDAGLVVADAALHRHLVTREELADSLLCAERRRGAPAAARVLAFADPGSMSVGETRSRIALRDAGLPAPVLQWRVCASDGTEVARTDFGWPERRTVGEFDGRLKYGRSLRPGQDVAEVLFEEKRREDTVRAEDLGMVRWVWADIDRFAPVAERLWRTFR